MKWKNLQMPKQPQIDESASNDRYGRFVIEPLERGFGLTLGNALRRVLLSSLQGAAVTAVRIEEALHEFSSLPGVIEDTTEIILNLKQVRFKLMGDGPKKGVFEMQGKGELRAGDLKIDADVEVLNPDLHIATLNKDGNLRMMKLPCACEFTSAVTNDRGERSASQNVSGPQPAPTSRIFIPFSTPARSQICASIASSASFSEDAESHSPQLYFMRGPRNVAKNVAGTSSRNARAASSERERVRSVSRGTTGEGCASRRRIRLRRRLSGSTPDSARNSRSVRNPRRGTRAPRCVRRSRTSSSSPCAP